MRPYLLLLLSACVGPRPPVVLETPEGVIHARSLETAKQAAELLGEYDPRVRAILGTANTRTPILQIGLYEYLEVEGVMEGRNVWPVYIRLQESLAPEIFVHELVHWHAVKEWDTLPAGVEEGLAHALGLLLTSHKGLKIYPPPAAMQERILTIARTSWNRHKSDELYEAAAWVYGAIGHAELHALAMRAREQARVHIPASWFTLPPAAPVFLPREWATIPGTYTYRILGGASSPRP